MIIQDNVLSSEGKKQTVNDRLKCISSCASCFSPQLYLVQWLDVGVHWETLIHLRNKHYLMRMDK